MSEKKPNYQILSQELNSILEKLQGTTVEVDEAVVLYGRGMELVKQMQQYLKEAQNKVTKIKANFDKS